MVFLYTIRVFLFYHKWCNTSIVNNSNNTPNILYATVRSIKLLAKLGTDGFSLVLFGTKVSDSKEFCKKSITFSVKDII